MKLALYTLFIIGLFNGCAPKQAEPVTPARADEISSSGEMVAKVSEQKDQGVSAQTDAIAQIPAANVQSKKEANAVTHATETAMNKTASSGVGSPATVIEKYTAELRKVALIDNENQKGKKNANRESAIASRVREFFDFQELALRSLGTKNSKKFTTQQKKEYVQLFTKLIETNYLRRSRTIIGDYQVVVQDEKINGSFSTVSTKVLRKDVDVSITYELHKPNKDANWMIYNIIFDDVNLVRNYQSQFNNLLAKGGASNLISLLRKKNSESAENDDIKL